jgi:hypothetical protein
MSQASVYPVDYQVEPQLTDRNRVTTLFRLILAIPQLIIAGGGPNLGYAFSAFVALAFLRRGGAYSSGESGLVGVATTMAVVSWFAIMFWHRHPRGLWQFGSFALRWQARVTGYVAMLRDDYPPFGDEDNYPARLVLPEFPLDSNRRSIGWRLVFLIPHFLVLFIVGVLYFLSAVIAWFAILLTGSYPKALYDFAIGYYRWLFRVQAYGLLLLDEYPPFSMS